jgi:5S rRNA maturation endonuclease (ribonuclease M5)
MFSNLEQLKNTVRIEDIVGKYVKLKKSSTGYVGLCPFHNEKTPSFNTRKDKNSFKCFGCGKGGNAIDFVSLHDNLGFVDAVRRVAELSNFTLEEDSKEIVKPVHRLEKLSKEFLENFENVRKISNNTLLRFGVTEGFEWMPKAKKEIKVVCFNYLRNGELINIKFRGKNKDMKLAKDAELIFYNIDSIQDTEDCVIVEGECFHPSAEILTENGWVSFEDYKEGRVAQYLENGSIDFINPLAVIKKPFNGELVELSNTKRFYSLTTPEHNLVFNKNGRLVKKKACELPKDNFHSIPRTSFHDGVGIPLSDLEIKLCIAISADFTLRDSGDLYAAFKKERKTERLKDILDKLGIIYSCNKDARGYDSFFIRRSNRPNYVFKLFPNEWINLSTQSQKRLIIDEILFWDGNLVPNRNQIEYSSKEYHNATFIQTISSLCGYCSTIIKRKNQFGSWYKVSILFGKQFTSVQGLRDKSKNIEYNGFVHCVTVPSGMLLVRQDGCISVSGNCDALSVYEAGIHNVVSVPNGANSNLKYIDNCYEYFINKKKIVIATDNDEAGRKLRDELMFRFGVDRCYMVDLPEDCKDSNDVLVKHGKDVLKKVIENATQIPIEGLTAYNERKNRLLDLYENGIPSGTPCGIYGFDEYLRFQGGLVTMITAPPSSGKSEFLDYIISSLAVRENWRFGVFSFENQPIELHDAKLAEKIIGKAFGFRKDKGNRIDKESLNLVIDELHDKFKIIDTSKVDISLDGVLSKSEEMVNKYGIKGLVIDPYNKILHSVPSGMTETNYVNFFMTKITSFAKRFNVHIFLVVHPTKPQNTSASTDGKPQRVTLYSASGSANFYNQTDNGFVLLRDRETGIVDVHIEKVRFNEQGREGWVSFTFDTMTRQYIFAGSKHPIQPQEQPQPQYITQSTPMLEFDDQTPF